MEKLPKQVGVVNETLKFDYEDDYYPLKVLTIYWTDGKKAPFTKILVDSLQLTSGLRSSIYSDL